MTTITQNCRVKGRKVLNVATKVPSAFVAIFPKSSLLKLGILGALGAGAIALAIHLFKRNGQKEEITNSENTNKKHEAKEKFKNLPRRTAADSFHHQSTEPFLKPINTERETEKVIENSLEYDENVRNNDNTKIIRFHNLTLDKLQGRSKIDQRQTLEMWNLINKKLDPSKGYNIRFEKQNGKLCVTLSAQGQKKQDGNSNLRKRVMDGQNGMHDRGQGGYFKYAFTNNIVACRSEGRSEESQKKVLLMPDKNICQRLGDDVHDMQNLVQSATKKTESKQFLIEITKAMADAMNKNRTSTAFMNSGSAQTENILHIHVPNFYKDV